MPVEAFRQGSGARGRTGSQAKRLTPRGVAVKNSSERIRVHVEASDPVSAMGISGELRLRSDVLVLDPADHRDAHVTVLVSDEVDGATAGRIRALHRDGCIRVVLVVTRLEDAGLMAAVEAGVCGILRRSEACSERVAEV